MAVSCPLPQLEFLSCALGGKARFASSTLLTSQRDQLRSHGFGVGQFDVLMQHMKVSVPWALRETCGEGGALTCNLQRHMCIQGRGVLGGCWSYSKGVTCVR